MAKKRASKRMASAPSNSESEQKATTTESAGEVKEQKKLPCVADGAPIEPKPARYRCKFCKTTWQPARNGQPICTARGAK